MACAPAHRGRKNDPARTPGRAVVILAIAVLICWAAMGRLERRVLREHASASPAFVQFQLCIDLNSASEAELQLLPTIGPRLAQRIVEDRERNGPFVSLDDLARVHGIGRTTIERLTALAVVVETSRGRIVEVPVPGE